MPVAVTAVAVRRPRADTAHDLMSIDQRLGPRLGPRKVHRPHVVAVADIAVGPVTQSRPGQGLRQGDVAGEAASMTWTANVGAEALATTVMLTGVGHAAAVEPMGTDECAGGTSRIKSALFRLALVDGNRAGGGRPQLGAIAE